LHVSGHKGLPEGCACAPIVQPKLVFNATIVFSFLLKRLFLEKKNLLLRLKHLSRLSIELYSLEESMGADLGPG
jgi:hypothetical protein